MSPEAGQHECPGCREKVVSNTLFACCGCWYLLPEEERKAISRTAHLPVLSLARRMAIGAARTAWAKQAASEEERPNA